MVHHQTALLCAIVVDRSWWKRCSPPILQSRAPSLAAFLLETALFSIVLNGVAGLLFQGNNLGFAFGESVLGRFGVGPWKCRARAGLGLVSRRKRARNMDHCNIPNTLSATGQPGAAICCPDSRGISCVLRMIKFSFFFQVTAEWKIAELLL